MNEIEFQVVPTQSKYLAKFTVENLSDNPVGFKIKSTFNKRYFVNPVIGILSPLQKQNIDVVLSLSEEELKLGKNIQDKFAIFYIPMNTTNIPQPNIETFIKQNQSKSKNLLLLIHLRFQPTRITSSDILSQSQSTQSAPDILQSMIQDPQVPDEKKLQQTLLDQENQLRQNAEQLDSINREFQLIKNGLQRESNKVPENPAKIKLSLFIATLIAGVILGAFFRAFRR